MVTNGRVIHMMGHGTQAPMFVLSGEVCTHQGLKAQLPAPWWVQNRGGSGARGTGGKDHLGQSRNVPRTAWNQEEDVRFTICLHGLLQGSRKRQQKGTPPCHLFK